MRVTVRYLSGGGEDFENVYEMKVHDGVLILIWYEGKHTRSFPLSSLLSWERWS